MKREVVKDRTTRKVARVVFDDGTDVHVKSVLLAGHPWRRLLVLFGRNKVEREARNLRRLFDVGVRAPEVIRTEMRRRHGIPVELTLTTRTLAGYRQIPEHAERDPLVALALGVYTRELHDRGVFHDDFHRGNVLWSAEGGFALLDADRVRFASATPEERERGLRRVLLAFRNLPEEAPFAAFLEGYGAPGAGIEARALRERAERDLLQHARARSRRAWRENPEFTRKVRGGLSWQARQGFEPPGDPEAVLADPARSFKKGRSTTVSMIDGEAVLKTFHPWRLWGRVYSRLRGSRARRAFRKGHVLELLGIATPRVLGYCDAPSPRWRPRSHLITARVPGAEQATSFLARNPGRAATRSFIRAAGALLGRLHRAGFSHRDLKGRNLLRSAEGACVLLDLDSLDDRGRIENGIRIKDLRRMVRSARELETLRFRWLAEFVLAYVASLGPEVEARALCAALAGGS